MLMRFDPFRELDRLTQQSVWNPDRALMAMDAFREDDRFVVQFDLPGVDPSTIDLTVEKNDLRVSAERRWERQEGQDVLASERPQGRFTRQLFLGDGLNPERIEATYDNGVLTVNVPVAEQAKPRKVNVTSGGSQAKAIDASSTAAA